MTRRLAVTSSAAMSALLVMPVALVALAVLPAPVAHAAAYRYWTYWQSTSDAQWQFATAGPAFTVPVDGSVEGWRFAVSSAAGTASASPRPAPDFAVICEGTAPVKGQKRIAVVVDAGLPEEAPAGQTPSEAVTRCVTADEDATGYAVLRSFADVRTEDGLVCGVAGYPEGECAPLVDEAVATDTPIVTHASTAVSTSDAGESGGSGESATSAATSSAGGPWVTAAVLSVIVVGIAWFLRRRRRG